MKKNYHSFLIFLFTLNVTFLCAQTDSLIWQDWQDFDEETEFYIFPDPPYSDDQWINWDEDQMDSGSPVGEVDFYLSLDFEQGELDTILPADTNVVVASISWLAGFDTSSSNWLITPLTYIGDDQATLHWKSASFQGPRYCDGYSVKVLTGSSFYQDTETLTTVFRSGEMTAILGETSSLDPNDYEFSEGYVHANTYTDSTYFIAADTSLGEDLNVGILEPHSVSLADYAGQWVHIAFHHDSADDNIISFDDILILGNVVSSTKIAENDLRFITYPNPVSNYLNVMFRTQEAADISLELFSSTGQKVSEIPLADGYVGEYNEQFDLRNLPAGSYSVVLTIEGQIFTKTVVRR